MKLSQENIDKIKHYSEVGFGVTFALLIVLGLIPEIWGIHIPKFVMLIVLTCLFLSMAVLIVSSFWATDEEEEEFKRAVREAVREERDAEQEKAPRAIIENREMVECPLVGLNDRQKKAIEDLLKYRIPTHAKDASRFDRAVVYNYLRALRSMHLLNPVRNSDDIDTFRKWVEQITGLYEPQEEWAHFRGDYDDFKRSNKKIQDAVKEIESEKEKFR